MDELKQIITYKLKLIHDYRDRTPNSVEQQQQITQILLKQKRKQNSRDVIESRLLQSLITKKIQAPYRVQQFYQQSIQLMQMYSPTFQYKQSQKKDPIYNIVKLYVEFFRQHDCSRRAEELHHIFRKNLCQKGMLIPTIFHWFAQWLRKIFREFIKRRLNQISEKTFPLLKDQGKNKRNIKFLQEINSQRASLFVIDKQIKQHKQNQVGLRLKSQKSQLLNFQFLVKPSRSPSKSSILNYSQKIENSSLPKLKDVNSNIQSIQKQPSSSTMPLVKIVRQSVQLKKQIKQKCINLNRNIFFSAFFQQMNNYYKFYSCLGELDENFLKNFRKIDRRQQINKNMNILVKSMVKSQPNQIKTSLEQYNVMYSAKFSKLKSPKDPNRIKNKALRKRAESVNLRKQNTQQNNPLIQHKTTDKIIIEDSQIFVKRQSHATRIEAERKKVQLELPDVKTFKSAQKIIVVNSSNSQQLIPYRYKNGLSLNQKQRVSAELYKQLKQISSLFKSRKSIRLETLTINKQTLDQRISSIRYRRSRNQSTQALQPAPPPPSVQPHGIFRLPKIHR